MFVVVSRSFSDPWGGSTAAQEENSPMAITPYLGRGILVSYTKTLLNLNARRRGHLLVLVMCLHLKNHGVHMGCNTAVLALARAVRCLNVWSASE